MLAVLLLVDPRRVGRVGDVDGDGEIGLEREGDGLGATQRDLLLRAGDAGDGRLDPGALGNRRATS